MALVTAVGGTVTAASLSRASEAEDRLISVLGPARTDVYRLRAAMLDQETGLRGFLITRSEESLEPYHRGSAAERQLRRSLAARLEQLPSARAETDEVGRAVDAWRRDHAEPVLRGDGDDFDTTGKAAFEGVRAALDSLQSQLEAERREARSELTAANQARDRVLYGVLGMFLLTGLGLLVLLHYSVGRPLERVSGAARRVAEGHFEHRIPQHGPADLRALARDVEAMRRRIVGELTTARRQRAEIARQAEELDQQAEELRRSNADLEQFAYVASHDLQEPLRKVASFCRLLEKRYGDQLDERGVQYIDFAVDGAKRMQVLIDDLLTYSRVGRRDDPHTRVELDDALDGALRNLDASLEEADAVVERPRRLPSVIGDPTLMTMLWQNLVGNAVKFRRPDRPPVVRIDARWSAEPLAGAAASDAGHWTFSVTDNGIGVAPEFAEKVFVIFQRLHNRDAYGGTGIGLSLCKKIVEQSGGTIALDTAHREGTRVVFTLPAVDGDQPGAAPPPADDGTAEVDHAAEADGTDGGPATRGPDERPSNQPVETPPPADPADGIPSAPTDRPPPQAARPSR
ncbi:CHASE3 domain-containing protein, partial [Streptomyces durbertensis]|nr:CHASE3 domain-containing protein [Streptomyces durbertensis]